MSLSPSNSSLVTGHSPLPAKAAKPISPAQRAAIHAQWHKIDMGRSDERDSRTARLEFVSTVCMRPVDTVNDLSTDEANQVLAAMRQETGEEFRPAGYRGKRKRRSRVGRRVSAEELTRIGTMAAAFFGDRWDELLRALVAKDPSVASPEYLTGSQARKLAEQLLNRLARAAIAERHQPPIHRWEIEAEVEVQRAKFFGPQITQSGA